MKRLRVLCVIEQCNPEWASVPLVGFNLYNELRELADVTLVTHARNRQALEKRSLKDVCFIEESRAAGRYYRWMTGIVDRGRVNWPLHHALAFPIYAEFDHRVTRQFGPRLVRGEFDILHAMPPILPRYPVKLASSPLPVPFVLGPVNGGLPFPDGFEETARQEFSHFNWLRALGRHLIPGYARTYRSADRVLAASRYTFDWVRRTFQLPDERLQLFVENGVARGFFAGPRSHSDKLRLLFVGRLVPYKCADVVIRALAQLGQSLRSQVSLRIVGDGPERANLQALAQSLGVTLELSGWVAPDAVAQVYREADVFCFPSVREFGGLVVLEALAAGLPCIVANHGGIAEYVTDACGYRIEPRSKDHLAREIARHVTELAKAPSLRARLSQAAVERAHQFEWRNKAEQMIDLYHQLLEERRCAA